MGVYMDLFDLVNLLGGLAIFLYGMHIMSEGLFKISGSNLERIIGSITSNTLKSVLFGAGITALIQSSSAATVMVVGFVNANYMSLSSAISIIMGSNIGTTITAWVLSLLGVESSSVWLKLIKPSTFAPILAFIGIVILFSSKNKKKKAGAESLFGFGILMIGMEMMSATVKPLANSPQFVQLITIFQNPILSILVGAIVTAIIQSSSASVGILQALSLTGAFSIQATIPIVLGQNIGTCITSMISSVGTSNNARRSAVAHLFFNIIGTVIFSAIFYTVLAFVKLPILSKTATPFTIAVSHTAFNIFATIILLPFIKQLEQLTYIIIPKAESEKQVNKFAKLESKFLQTPSFALDQCYDLISEMADKDLISLDLVNKLKNNYNEQSVALIEKYENENDEYEDNLKKYCTKINLTDMSTKNALRLSAYVQCINDLERISDHILMIQQSYQKLLEEKYDFSDKAVEELDIIGNATYEILEIASNVFKTGNQTLAYNVEPLDAVINDLQKRAIKKHTKRMKKLACTPQVGFYYADILNSYVRISAYCSNIAIAFIQDNNESVSEHVFQEYAKQFDDNYKIMFAQYSEKYVI